MKKSVFVTGASRGIGKAISLRMAKLGHSVFLVARDEKALDAVADECRAMNANVGYLAGELTDTSYLDIALQAAVDAHGAVDVLVNNAGAARPESMQEANLEAWRQIMDLNFNSVAYLSRQVLPAMIEKGAGSVINISSISGRSGSAGNGIYSATKHALNGLSECMYEDVRDHGIKVSSIMPGFVNTSLTGDMGLNSGNMITPEDVADAVEYVVSSSPTCCPTEIVLRPQLRP
tara:strand:+ start:7245 stop:7943 length:699 start_codon:yes stop_codon:yes gene_type:complete